MDACLSHSAKGNCPPQTYQRHVEGVCALAGRYAEEAAAYRRPDSDAFVQMVQSAAAYHDLGKLDADNQRVLHQPDGAGRLPVHHQDAGAAWLVQAEAFLSAYLVRSHHTGLNDLADENTSEADGDRPIFRDDDPRVRARVDQTLNRMAQLHHTLIPQKYSAPNAYRSGDLSVLLRMGLSCLADADHTDTALHYGQYPAAEGTVLLRPEERLARLDEWVASLGGDDARSRLRQEMYESCRNSPQAGGFASCDSPVGSGKTTAVMAHLLRQAAVRGARRIFVVLPYTSIISQSVGVYRAHLTLPGEDPERVVAELHHRADFDRDDTRYLTALWRAPIVVTTAVAFFETMASNRPGGLRRLHELPGSMIFVDECHAALPVHLLPTAWHWMRVLAEEWQCYWVLASGSLVRFWQLEDFTRDQADVGTLVSEGLRKRLMQYERQRTDFRCDSTPKSRREMVTWVQASPGPRLLILCTVQTAAVLADDLRNAYGRERVEHLSTALSAQDREATLRRIKARLQDEQDTDWTLVATSCVEAGVDFSFRTGFREVSSLLSLLQAAGRVNREGLFSDAVMWSFTLQDDPMLTRNPGLRAAQWVLEQIFHQKREIAPSLSTMAVQQELHFSDNSSARRTELLENEMESAFQRVAHDFVVIDRDQVIIVADEALAKMIRDGQADWRRIQKCGISIPRSRARALHLTEIRQDIYWWHLAYDGFLGYMAGVIKHLADKERR